MVFRTEIEIPRSPVMDISHDQGLVMLGSCFTDNVGALLQRDGFDVTFNPLGPLYNPASILNAMALALGQGTYILKSDTQGVCHCLNFASRYARDSQAELVTMLNSQLECLAERIRRASTVILTLGTAWVFRLLPQGEIVGNCHKFPASDFSRELLSPDQILQCLAGIVALLPDSARVIFTVSPIRHTADTLHGNQLSKAALLLAIDRLTADPALKDRMMYFPAYEIMMDDLRDYRFYAADMKHPSPVAVDYIYDVFSSYYFSKDTIAKAMAARKAALRNAHRPIL